MWSAPEAVRQSIVWPISSLSVNPTSTQNPVDTRLNFPSRLSSNRISPLALCVFRFSDAISVPNLAISACTFAGSFVIVNGVTVGDSYFLRPTFLPLPTDKLLTTLMGYAYRPSRTRGDFCGTAGATSSSQCSRALRPAVDRTAGCQYPRSPILCRFERSDIGISDPSSGLLNAILTAGSVRNTRPAAARTLPSLTAAG